eukprot:141654-Pyramimonas_sp.AAC.1
MSAPPAARRRGPWPAARPPPRRCPGRPPPCPRDGAPPTRAGPRAWAARRPCTRARWHPRPD